MKKYSFLSHKPDWRYRAAISNSLSVEECTDQIVIRYLKAKKKGFSEDPELFCVINMTKEDRGLIEALHLGGASLEEISEYTQTDISVIKLVLDLFFDIGKIKSPILRMQLAQKEKNRVVKSYKVFSAKYGFEEFIKQFLRKDELDEHPTTVKDAYDDLFTELKKKISELGMFETGSSNSKELYSWMKLLLELTREMRENEGNTDVSGDLDIQKLMNSLNKDSETKKKKNSFKHLPSIHIKKEEEDEPGSS